MRTSVGVSTRKRIALVFLGVSCLLTLLLGRLTYVQVIRNDLYRQRAMNQRLRPVPVDAKRGTIYDRHGRELAVSVSADSIYAIPAEIKKPDAKVKPIEIAAELASILGADKSEILKKITSPVSTVWIQRKVDPAAADKVRKAKLPGIGVSERSQRFYPKERLASHILGLAGIDNQGLEGLELYYENYLKGNPGRIVAERDGKGRQIPQGISRYIPPQDGSDLYLTIDEVIQYIVERELDKAMAATGSAKGVAIIMDPMTGEILAMASRPDYNPNRISDYPSSNRRNIAVSDSYEPGSTFKAVTAASALEEGCVKTTDTFDDPGYIIVEDRRLKCWKAGGHGHQSFIQAVENSCNPVFVRLATALGKEKFYEYIKAFGFGVKTGIDYPGESSGLLAPEGGVGPVELATIGFGQGVSVTPLQIVNALSTIVNGGYQVKPHLLKEVKASNGKVVRKVETEKLRQVISKATSHELKEILASVVANGSGKAAGVPGYRVGGKTGTAQIPDKGHYGNKVVASFMGFTPVDKPRLVGIVALYEPNTPITFGSVLAAPVFGAIAKDALRYLDVKPTESTAPKDESGQEQKLPAEVHVPDVRNLPLEDALDALNDEGLKGRYQGEGLLVVEQVPKPGSITKRDSTVILELSPKKAEKGASTIVTLPDLSGRTIKEVGAILSRVGLKLRLIGSGIAVKQMPAPGTKVKWGSTIEVRFEDAAVNELPNDMPDGDTENRQTGKTDRKNTSSPVDSTDTKSDEDVTPTTSDTPVMGLHP